MCAISNQGLLNVFVTMGFGKCSQISCAVVDSGKQRQTECMAESGTDMRPPHSLVLFYLIVMLEYSPKIMVKFRH